VVVAPAALLEVVAVVPVFFESSPVEVGSALEVLVLSSPSSSPVDVGSAPADVDVLVSSSESSPVEVAEPLAVFSSSSPSDVGSAPADVNVPVDSSESSDVDSEPADVDVAVALESSPLSSSEEVDVGLAVVEVWVPLAVPSSSVFVSVDVLDVVVEVLLPSKFKRRERKVKEPVLLNRVSGKLKTATVCMRVGSRFMEKSSTGVFTSTILSLMLAWNVWRVAASPPFPSQSTHTP